MGYKRLGVLIAGVAMIYLNPHLGDDAQLKASMALVIAWFVTAGLKIIADAYKKAKVRVL